MIKIYLFSKKKKISLFFFKNLIINLKKPINIKFK